jgi:hypothetical protein
VIENSVTDAVILTLTSNLNTNSGAFIRSAAFNLLGDIAISDITCNPRSICVELSYRQRYNEINLSNQAKGLDLELFFLRAIHQTAIGSTGQRPFPTQSLALA